MLCQIRRFSCPVWLRFLGGITLRGNPNISTRGCGCPVGTSAKGRSTDRGDSRDPSGGRVARPLISAWVYLQAALPSRFLVMKFLQVSNSLPTIPNLMSHVLIANFGFSVCCGLGLAVLRSFAIWLSARQS